MRRKCLPPPRHPQSTSPGRQRQVRIRASRFSRGRCAMNWK